MIFGFGSLRLTCDDFAYKSSMRFFEMMKVIKYRKNLKELHLKRIVNKHYSKILRSYYRILFDYNTKSVIIGRSLINFVKIIRRLKKRLCLDGFRAIERKTWSEDLNKSN